MSCARGTRTPMRVEQHPYLSPQAKALRRRDGIAPWSVHPCECDAFADWPLPDPLPNDATAFDVSLAEARRQRAALEGKA